MPVRVDSKKETQRNLSTALLHEGQLWDMISHPQRDNLTYTMILIRFMFLL